jgi:hypothetical protein
MKKIVVFLLLSDYILDAGEREAQRFFDQQVEKCHRIKRIEAQRAEVEEPNK